MKIQPDHVHPTIEEQQRQKTEATPKGSSFEDILAKESGASQQVAKPATPPPLMGLNPLLQVQAPEAATSNAENKVMDQMENLLDEWEKYAGQLGSTAGQADLRQAYSSLQRIGDQVKTIKSGLDDMQDNQPGLKAMVDEMEIMTVTETIKFNRGDYL
jgi:hypothetical protein